MLDKIANRKYCDQAAFQKQSDLCLSCLTMPFWRGTSVRNLEQLVFEILNIYHDDSIPVSVFPAGMLQPPFYSEFFPKYV